MASYAAHILNKYYTDYNNREIAFNKSTIKFTGLEPKKIFLKIAGDQWSCVLYSCSMKSAKIILKMDVKAFDQLKKAKNFVNLRLSFFTSEMKSSIVFFVPGSVKGYKNFLNQNTSTFLMTIDFTQRPPDDLIEILGKIIKEREDFEKRKDIRILLEGKITFDIGFKTNKCIAVIDNIKRPCIIKNISAGGAMIVLACNPKFILNKPIKLIFVISYLNEPLFMEGIIKRSEGIEGRKDIYSIGVEYEVEKIPIEYKKLINNYLNKLEDYARQK
ncbi:MAG: PilZ domain-containing protein [Spirochaetes bacterium]|nr:PilZ domain-containing protein [Spirochaetota bacterium]